MTKGCHSRDGGGGHTQGQHGDVTIRLPDPCLVVLVGVAGAGKSTWAAPVVPAGGDRGRPTTCGRSSAATATTCGRRRTPSRSSSSSSPSACAAGLLTVIDSTALDADGARRLPAPRRAPPACRATPSSSTRPSARRGPATAAGPRPSRRPSSRASCARSPPPSQRSTPPAEGFDGVHRVVGRRPSRSCPARSTTHRPPPGARRRTPCRCASACRSAASTWPGGAGRDWRRASAPSPAPPRRPASRRSR